MRIRVERDRGWFIVCLYVCASYVSALIQFNRVSAAFLRCYFLIQVNTVAGRSTCMRKSSVRGRCPEAGWRYKQMDGATLKLK